MLFVRREDWGAPPTSLAAYIAETRGVKVHYLGSPYSSRAHSGCDDKVREIRAAHLANTAEGYVDIAYNALVCEHGYVFEGRGAHKRCGANGTSSLNLAHYAVCALLGSSGMTQPTDAMLHGLRDAIEWLRSAGAADTEIRGHRDGWATACPGDPLYAWVRAGAPRPTEDDMATPIEIADAVLARDKVPNSGPDAETNPTLSPAEALRRLDVLARRTEAKIDALTTVNSKLVEAVGVLASGLGDLDPAAIVAELKASIESVTIQLDVPGSPAS